MLGQGQESQSLPGVDLLWDVKDCKKGFYKHNGSKRNRGNAGLPLNGVGGVVQRTWKQPRYLMCFFTLVSAGKVHLQDKLGPVRKFGARKTEENKDRVWKTLK